MFISAETTLNFLNSLLINHKGSNHRIFSRTIHWLATNVKKSDTLLPAAMNSQKQP
jgi:hypothetical protein